METTDCDSEEESDIQLPIVGDFATKILRLSGMTLELRDTTRTHDIIGEGYMYTVYSTSLLSP